MMTADAQATAIHEASLKVINAVRPIRDLSRKIINPISVNKDTEELIFMHPDSVTLLKKDAAGMRAAWNTAKAALDAAFTS